MFRLWRRRRVVPEVDQYISQRYEDTAVRIFIDLKQGRGLHSTYVPWIQAMLIQYIPTEEMRLVYWHDQVPLYYNTLRQAWTEETNRISNDIDKPHPSMQDSEDNITSDQRPPLLVEEHPVNISREEICNNEDDNLLTEQFASSQHLDNKISRTHSCQPHTSIQQDTAEELRCLDIKQSEFVSEHPLSKSINGKSKQEQIEKDGFVSDLKKSSNIEAEEKQQETELRHNRANRSKLCVIV